LAPPKWSISSSSQGDHDRLNLEEQLRKSKGGGFVVELVTISSSLFSSELDITSVFGIVAGGLEEGL